MRKILSLTTEQANQPKPGMMPQVGDVVIIYSKEHPKLQWKWGIILELHKSDEGQSKEKPKLEQELQNLSKL